MKKIILPPNVVSEINYLVEKYMLVLLEFKNGYVFLLVEHHRYLNPYRDAPRSKIIKSPVPVTNYLSLNNLLYLTDPI